MTAAVPPVPAAAREPVGAATAPRVPPVPAGSLLLGATAFRALLLALLLLQSLPALLGTGRSLFWASYWVPSYREGFVRRGLGGTVLALGQGQVVPYGLVQAGMAASWLVPLLAVVVLAEILVRRHDTHAWLLALLLVSSPFVLDQLTSQQRPDQLGLALLVAVGLAARRARRPLLLAALAGAGSTVLVLVHEGTFFYFLPFTALLVVLAAPAPRRWAALALAAGPPAAALVAVSLLGRPTPVQLAGLAEAAPPPLAGSGAVLRFLDYLQDSPLDALRRVGAESAASQVSTLAFGAVLLGLHVLLLRGTVATPGARGAGPALSRPLRAVLLCLAVGAVLMIFSTGTDWMRWVCVYGGASLVTWSLLHLGTEVAPGPRGRAVAVPVAALALCVYLAALAPLPVQTDPGDVAASVVTFGL